MSWFRSALSIGAEAANAGGKAVGTGFVRASSFASSVVQRAGDAVLLAGDAVEHGAKMVYEHAEHAVGGTSARQHNSFRHAVRRIEEVAMLARGAERKEALLRWLGALADISAESEQAEQGEKELAALQQLGMGLALGGDGAGGSEEGGAGEAVAADEGAGEAGEVAEESAAVNKAEATGPPAAAHGGGGGGGGGGAAAAAAAAAGSDGGVREGVAPPSASPQHHPLPSPRTQAKMSRVLFHDPNAPHQALTFRDVFLHSQALENVVASLVMDPGDDEEYWLLRNLFRLCLSLPHEDQDTLLATLHSLAHAAESYAEVKLSGDELERFVAEAITGLKASPEAERVDAEARRLERAVAQGLAMVQAASALEATDEGEAAEGVGVEVEGRKGEEGGEGAGGEQAEGEEGVVEAEKTEGKEGAAERALEAERAVDEVLAVQGQEVQAVRSREVLRAALRLVALERRREALLQQGDTPGDRALKVERVTSLAAELGEGVAALRAQMAECTQQRADALAYRTAKSQEAADADSVVDREMAALQKRKAELQEELSKVQSAIDSVSKKQGKAREEKEQFSMASSSIVSHLTAQEARLSASVAEHEGDSRALDEWRKFLQTTWQLQSAAVEAQEKKLKEEAAARRDRLFAAATSHLHLCQSQVESCWGKAKALAEKLSSIHDKRAAMTADGTDAVVADISLRRIHWEQKFIAAEMQVRRCMGEAELALKEVRAWMDSLPSPSTEDASRLHSLRVLGLELDALIADIRAAPRPVLAIDHPSVLRVPRIATPAASAAAAPAPTAAPPLGATFPAAVVIAPVGNPSASAAAGAPAVGVAGARRPFKPLLQIGGDAGGGMGGGAPESPEDGAPMTPFVISGGMRRPQGGGFRDEQGRLRRPGRKPGVASIAEGLEGTGAGDKGGGEGGRGSSEGEQVEGVVADGGNETGAAEKVDAQAEGKEGNEDRKEVTW
ncbi:hypothetical protein CLOM_g21340 [Closterium sp. NIES-68]|nr:hypothetical protein CLOM_g21340 [Closterium sp. NIES-68]